MIVAITDFDFQPYNLPGLETKVPTFTKFAESCELEVLSRLLGYDLYKQFIDGLAALTPDAKWAELRDGKEMVIDAVKYRFGGIKALLIPYIYAMWTRATFDNHSQNGVEIAKVENAESISPAKRIVDAYMKASILAGKGCLENSYEEYSYKYLGFLTLYGFLYQSNYNIVPPDPMPYTNWSFQPLGEMNIFNI